MSSPEFALLERLAPLLDGDAAGVPLGVGDDAAVVEVDGHPVAVAVDAIVDGVHVDRSVSSPEDVGWKALAVNVSDMAAIGARPTAAVVALQRPVDMDDRETVAVYRGMRAAADRWDVRLVGGDVVRSPVLSVSVTVVGGLVTDRPLRRGGAEAGDAVVVVGAVGLAAAGLAAHRAGRTDLLEAHPELLAAHRRPPAYPEAGAALAAHGAHACIDVSDGLGRDLGHVATASDVGIALDAAQVPLAAGVEATAIALGHDPVEMVVGGGEDFALVACVPPDRLESLAAALTTIGHRPVRIGEVVAGRGVALVGPDGDTRDVSTLGYEHR